jgi:hypothetical protein
MPRIPIPGYGTDMWYYAGDGIWRIGS